MTSLRGKVFSLLVQILKKAYALDFIKKHLGDLIEKGKTQDERLDALSIEDQQRLVQNLDLDTNFGKRVMFYLLTGARPAEMKTVTEIKKDSFIFAARKQSTQTVGLSYPKAR